MMTKYKAANQHITYFTHSRCRK